MPDQRFLSDRRFIKAWRDDEHGFSAGVRRSLDLFDGAASALLSGAHDEGELFRHGPARRLNHLKVFSLVEIGALAG